jgi:HAD superfamily hydrolase (TIGR01509 family)
MREFTQTPPNGPLPPAAFDLVIFDCDGVLVDSEVISLETLLATLRSHGAEIDLDYAHATYLGRSFPTVIADFRNLTGRVAPEGLEADYLARLFAAYRRELRAMAGAHALLSGLARKFCMATSSGMERATLSLQLTGLYPFFREAIFTASMVGRGKPTPDLFLHAAAACAAEPSRCLVIEDSEVGVLGALNAGMTVWRFVGGTHFRDTPAPIGHSGNARLFHTMTDVAAALASE